MPRQTTEPDREITLYELKRKAAGFEHRADAAKVLNTISENRLEKLENGRLPIQPADVRLMAECYNAPELYNYYCRHDCKFAKLDEIHVPEVEIKDIAQLTIETIAAVNRVRQLHDQLIAIVEDGAVTQDEVQDVLQIQAELKQLSDASASMQTWIEKVLQEKRPNQA